MISIFGIKESSSKEEREIRIEPEVEQNDDQVVDLFQEPKEEPKPVEQVREEPKVVAKPKEVEQPSLFDVEMKATLVQDKDIVLPKKVEADEEGVYYRITKEFMLDIMVSATKAIKDNLLEKWQNLKKLTNHPALGKAASLLIDLRPLVASKKIMIVTGDFTNVVNKVNEIAIQKDLQGVTATVFGNKMFVYAVSRAESIDYQKMFTDLRSINKLPKGVVIEFEGED